MLIIVAVAQIADFGMSRDLSASDYYVSQGGKIPIKWTAPEVIMLTVKPCTIVHIHAHLQCTMYAGYSLQEVLHSQ